MKITLRLLVAFSVLSLFVASCGPGQIFGPTFTPTNTPTSTATLSPSATPSPTRTPKPTATPSSTPNVSCNIKDGKWESNEQGEGFLPLPLLTFVVKNCQVTQVEIWSYPAPGELFWVQIDEPMPIQSSTFSYTETDSLGTYKLDGTFDSQTSAHGSLFFPKGFNVFDYILPNDVTLEWSAAPVE